MKVIDPYGVQNYYFVLKTVKTDAVSQNVNSEWIKANSGRESSVVLVPAWDKGDRMPGDSHSSQHVGDPLVPQKSPYTWVTIYYQRGIGDLRAERNSLKFKRK